MDGADAGEEFLAADLVGAFTAGLGEGVEAAAVGGGVAGVQGVEGGEEFGRVVGVHGADGVAEGGDVGGGAFDAEAFEGGFQGGDVAVPLEGVAERDGESGAGEQAAGLLDGGHGGADAGEPGVGADEAGDPVGGRRVGGEGDPGGLPHVLEFLAGDADGEVGDDEVEEFGCRGGRAVDAGAVQEGFGLPLRGGAERSALEGAAAGEVVAQVLGGGGEAAEVRVRGEFDAAVGGGEGPFRPFGAGRHLRDAGPDQRAAVGEGVAEGADGDVGGVPAAGVPVEAEVGEGGPDDGRAAVEAGEQRGVEAAEGAGEVGVEAAGAFGGGGLRLDEGADVGRAGQGAGVDVAVRRAGLASGRLLGKEHHELRRLGAGDRRPRRHVRTDGHPRQFGRLGAVPLVRTAALRLLVLDPAEPRAELGDLLVGGLHAFGEVGDVPPVAAWVVRGGPDEQRVRDVRRRGRVGDRQGREVGR